jgi:hypothetical protein
VRPYVVGVQVTENSYFMGYFGKSVEVVAFRCRPRNLALEERSAVQILRTTDPVNGVRCWVHPITPIWITFPARSLAG